MSEFFTTDSIAIYGALVSTIAIFISWLQYRHTIKEKEIKLKIKFEKIKDFEQEIEEFGTPYNTMTGKGGSSTKSLYIATVNNDGNYRAYINEIYGITENGKQHYAHLKIQQGISNNEFLKKLSSEHKEYIEPKSTKDYNIYFSKDSKSFILKKCIVVDGSGKKWRSSSHFSSGNVDN